MTLQAVRMCFDQGRAVSSTGTSNRCGHCLIHHFGIETVARHAGHFETRSSRSEEHTSELQSLMRSSYAVFCLKKKNNLHKLKMNDRHRHTLYLVVTISQLTYQSCH